MAKITVVVLTDVIGVVEILTDSNDVEILIGRADEFPCDQRDQLNRFPEDLDVAPARVTADREIVERLRAVVRS